MLSRLLTVYAVLVPDSKAKLLDDGAEVRTYQLFVYF